MKEIKVDINGIEHTIQVSEDDPRGTESLTGTEDAKKPANKSGSTEKK